MAQKETRGVIVLGGRVDNTFTRLGQSLMAMGGLVDDISRKLIDFGKESMGVYKNYEDSMLDAQVALSTAYGQGTKELKSAMRELDTAATDWAANSIFHTNDVADAIAKAAHAGWDLDKIMEGVPAAMKLAQAGSLELSQGVDYIIKSTNAAGISFGDLSEFIDEAVYAANSSAGDVEQFFEAMTRMGSTMRFTDSKEELLTMLAVLHDAGTTGSDAGTLLRNSMIRLIAPTKKASDMMETLGVTQADIDEAMAETSGDTEAMVKKLNEMGFSAYDSKGDLKGFLEIFKDLGDVTKDMTEKEKYDVWSSIFPTRTITGAMAMIEAAKDDYKGLYAELTGGAAEGYGSYASDVMMSGLTGAEELFYSKVENLQKAVGENLSPQMQTVYENLGKVIDLLASGGVDNGVSAGLGVVEDLSGVLANIAENIGSMDPRLFDSLMEGLGVIAVAGPGLMGAGFAFHFLGTALGNPAGLIMAGALAIVAVAKAVEAWKEADFKTAFGDMDLDTTDLRADLGEIKKGFDEAYKPVNDFRNALDGAVDNYKKASEEFSSRALSDMISGKELTEEDLTAYQNMGTQMVEAVLDGLKQSSDLSAEYWALLASDHGENADYAADPQFQGIIGAIDSAYQANVGAVEEIGKNLRSKITEAFQDGKISPEEYDSILATFNDLNAKMAQAEAEAKSREELVQREMLFQKGQRLSYDSAMDFIDNEVAAQRQDELDLAEAEFLRQRAELAVAYDQQMGAEGLTKYERARIQRQKNSALEWADQQWAEEQAGIYGSYDEMISKTMMGLIHSSDYGDAARKYESLVTQMVAGKLTDSQVRMAMEESYSGQMGGLKKLYSDEIARLGGIDAVRDRAGQYAQSGNAEMAGWMEMLASIYALNNSTGPTHRNAGYMGSYAHNLQIQEMKAENAEWLSQYGSYAEMTPGEIWRSIQALAASGNTELLDYFTAALKEGSTSDDLLFSGISAVAGNEVEEISKALQSRYNLPAVPGDYEAQQMAYLMTNPQEAAQYQIEIESPEEAATKGHEEMQTALDGLGSLSTTAEVQNALEAARTARDQMQAFASQSPIVFETSLVDAGVAALIGPSHIGGGRNISGETMAKKAKGGRETKPSIFAEAGIPEWYIPEEHTGNTAALLLAAAAGSGFSIADLAMYAGANFFADGGTDGSGSLSWGSLNDSGAYSGGGGNTFTVQYSPVIHSDGGSSVEEALINDKRRFSRWIEEWWKKKELYEDMVAYK